MKFVKLFSFCVVVLFSCNEKSSPHLPDEKMEQVLADIHLAEVYSMLVDQDSSNRSRERNYDSLAVYYQTVFKHHKITHKQFEESLNWYKAHPEELDSIYVRMIPEMSKLEGVNTYRLR